MLIEIQRWIRRILFPFLIATVGKGLMRLLLLTCRWEIRGSENFRKTASKEKCILMLWHNRLVLTPFILERCAPDFTYSAIVSKSRDGNLISAIVKSYKQGKTITVSHQARHQALKEMIQEVEAKGSIVVITPDGPRGPRYEIKPGIAAAAIATSAHVVPFTWEASKLWKLNTWDQLHIPKPFATITVTFKDPVVFLDKDGTTLEQAKSQLQNAL